MPDHEAEVAAVLAESTPEDYGWVHNPCGTVLIGAKVHHSIWDGPFPCSGSGEVHIEVVPYCPTCQEPPSPYGVPIITRNQR